MVPKIKKLNENCYILKAYLRTKMAMKRDTNKDFVKSFHLTKQPDLMIL